MRLSATVLAWLIAANLLLPASPCRAQQAPGNVNVAAAAARRAYFTRVQTQADAAPASRGARYGGRLDSTTAVAGRGLSDDRFRNEGDPLAPYGETVASTSPGRPYEQARPLIQPQRALPPAPVSHNYFPGMRSGQGTNRNVVAPHCVPGRNAFLHR
jgi:hypothetical protein